jgi:alkanesulfonate monooxygenase SsuD/methylene tetrahydromethanopterin reductase-like flavin-dependent oxidoreductase (luciferase family)
MANTPLAILDLVPISSGSTAAHALRNSLDLACQAEQAGYHRYWFAEHHLNPGVAGTSPAVMIALTAAATGTIRLGSGAVQMGHRTALATVEEFGLIDAMYPGRLDLGLGRSAGRPPAHAGSGAGAPVQPHQARADQARADQARADQARADQARADQAPADPAQAAASAEYRTARSGLLIPPRFSFERLLASPRLALHKRLLQLPGAESQNYTEQVDDVLSLLHGTFKSADGIEAHVVPGEGAGVQVWILGSSGGESAQAAGERGLRFAANYHVSPATVLEAVDGYRAAFRPSPELSEPYVSVSADVVVGADEPTARELAAGYGLWVRSIRTGEGAIAFPTPEQALAHAWSDEDRALVLDRTQTQFVGTAKQVADKLEQLRDATGADELIVTTITHKHADRVRSYQLLADEWQRR